MPIARIAALALVCATAAGLASTAADAATTPAPRIFRSQPEHGDGLLRPAPRIVFGAFLHRIRL